MDAKSNGIELVCVADVVAKPVEWLWHNRIPLGMLTLFAGDPGLGKSMTTAYMASAVSRGKPWPDSPTAPQAVGGVVLLSAEDDPSRTIKPRLIAHGADCDRVFILKSPTTRSHRHGARLPVDHH
jgi:putative DNA primase/helicase